MKKLDDFLALPHKTIFGSTDNPRGHIYRLTDSGTVVYRIVINTGIGVGEKNILNPLSQQ